MKKYILSLFLLLFFLPLSGCSYSGLNPQGLMSPPKANADQQSIHKLLQGDKQDITFKYPKSGEYRSAIIMEDFSGDNQEDAIGFYALEDDSVAVQFLIKDEEKWKTVATFTNTATQVDRVCFGDFNGDQRQDVLIGWGSTTGVTGRTAMVCAYLFENDGTITEISLGTYGEMTVTDFDNDGVDEIFTADKFVASMEEEGEDLPALAKLYTYADGSIQAKMAAEADNTVVNYSGISFGKINWNQYGVLLDGTRADGSTTTQIFFLDKNTQALQNHPLGVNTKEYSSLFLRPSTATLYSRDINQDGVLEIPVVSLLPGISVGEAQDVTSYMVEWSTYDTIQKTRRCVLRTLMNPSENYWFELPYALKGKITASNDAAKRTVTYTEVVTDEKTGENLLGSPLFSIRVFSRSAWNSRGETSGYEYLTQWNDQVYGIQSLSSDQKNQTYLDKVKNTFHILEE